MDRGVGVGVGEALALEVQAPFARLLVDGEKSIDVRGYALSTAKLTPNARVYVLETTRGTPGKSVLADAWTKGGFNPRSRADVARRLREPWFGGDARERNDDPCPGGTPGASTAKIIGWVAFDGAEVKYASAEAFARDADKHLVVDAASAYHPAYHPAPDSDASTRYGWRVTASGVVGENELLSYRRIHRSVFAVKFAARAS
jgi:hypothetical protein